MISKCEKERELGQQDERTKKVLNDNEQDKEIQNKKVEKNYDNDDEREGQGHKQVEQDNHKSRINSDRKILK